MLHGDCRVVLPTLDADSVQCVVTSPPYYGLRDYGMVGQLGLEPTPNIYVKAMVAVFREVRRVLRPDGTCWLNLGDSYAGSRGSRGHGDGSQSPMPDQVAKQGTAAPARNGFPSAGIKPKDLMMIPARVALALQSDGWWLRSDIIWAKPNRMPESVTDRPTSAHEHVFLLTKSARYFYDADAIRDAPTGRTDPFGIKNTKADGTRTKERYEMDGDVGANAGNVWTIATDQYSGAHFATMPPELAERCVKAGSKPGDTVLDPFAGSGTTAMVADRLQRHAIGIDLNVAYRDLAIDRVRDDAGLFADVSA